MKKSNCVFPQRGRIVVSLCVLCMAICCTQDYEDMHTVYVNDTIQTSETDSHSTVNVESENQSEANPITKSITFCEETQCYNGEFLSLYTDYSKSELTTDIINLDLDLTSDIIVSAIFLTDTSGDMVRLIMRYYDGDILLSEKIFTGMTLIDRTTDVVQNAAVPLKCNSIIIAVQAKYDSKKGGSKTDVIKFCNIKISHIINNDEIICKEICSSMDEDVSSDIEDNTDDRTEHLEFLESYELITQDESNDNSENIYGKEYTDESNDITSEESLNDIEYSFEEISEEVINDMSDDNTIICNEIYDSIDEDVSVNIEDNTGDKIENLEFTESSEFIIEDESNDNNENIYEEESTNDNNDIYEVTISDLRTDYSKCHIEMSDYLAVQTNEITVEMSFCSDSSGDMVRAVIECYDEEYNLLDIKNLTGARSSAGEWVINERKTLLFEGTVYIKIYAEAKYESKKGGGREDIIVCRGIIK